MVDRIPLPPQRTVVTSTAPPGADGSLQAAQGDRRLPAQASPGLLPHGGGRPSSMIESPLPGTPSHARERPFDSHAALLCPLNAWTPAEADVDFRPLLRLPLEYLDLLPIHWKQPSRSRKGGLAPSHSHPPIQSSCSPIESEHGGSLIVLYEYLHWIAKMSIWTIARNPLQSLYHLIQTPRMFSRPVPPSLDESASLDRIAAWLSTSPASAILRCHLWASISCPDTNS